MSIIHKLLFLTLFATGLIFAQDKAPAEKSHLEFSEDSFNFGQLQTDSLVTHVFNFKNTGSDTIEIHNVGSS
jgi:hypothetical protein